MGGLIAKGDLFKTTFGWILQEENNTNKVVKGVMGHLVQTKTGPRASCPLFKMCMGRFARNNFVGRDRCLP